MEKGERKRGDKGVKEGRGERKGRSVSYGCLKERKGLT